MYRRFFNGDLETQKAMATNAAPTSPPKGDGLFSLVKLLGIGMLGMIGLTILQDYASRPLVSREEKLARKAADKERRERQARNDREDERREDDKAAELAMQRARLRDKQRRPSKPKRKSRK